LTNNRLSHSAISRYQICPRSYKYWYIDKIKPRYQSAALSFGSALDNAINTLLSKDSDKTPEQVFEYHWSFQKVANKEQYLPECLDIVYSYNDYDDELLSAEDFIKLDEKKNELKLGKETTQVVFEKITARKKDKGFDNLSFEEKSFFNLVNWFCLKRKGLLMIESYREKVLPDIQEVIFVQRHIKVINNDGDSIIGVIDLCVKWKDGRTVIFDNKTSSIEYEKDCVLTSPQLALYVYAVENEVKSRTAGYIVLSKRLNKKRIKICSVCKYNGTGTKFKTCNNEIDGKRCNATWNEKLKISININVFIDEIPEKTEKLVMENYNIINNVIKRDTEFSHNFNNCDNVYGAPCPYKKYCWKGDKSDLNS